jgi:hypothetical protein
MESFKLFKGSNFSNYRLFCSFIRNAIISENTDMYYSYLLNLTDIVRTMFGLTDEDSCNYVINFFMDEMFTQFDSVIANIYNDFYVSIK